MQTNLPVNEASRLETLKSYNILDTTPEQAFDDLTLLASKICGTPIALVSLSDADRQWFKSKRGIAISQLQRDIAFCAHALLNPEEILYIPDTRQDERFAENELVTGETGILFYAGAPIVTSEGEAMGTLCVIDQQPRVLDDEQKQALQALSRQVMAQMDLRRQYTEALNQLAYKIQIEEALRESQSRFQAFMDHSPVLAFLLDEEGRYLYVNQPFLQGLGLSSEEVLGQEYAAVWPQTQVLSAQTPVGALANASTTSSIEMRTMGDGQAHCWQVWRFPLETANGRGKYLAGIALDITETKRYEQELELSQRQLEEALRYASALGLIDELTGLNNRRALTQRLAEEVGEAKRHGHPLSLLMLDVDRFKQFNDTFGHPAGDKVLQSLARLLNSEARTSDSVARYGGEEFVIILPHTDQEGARVLAERFRGAVEALPWDKRPVTVSIGVATLGTAVSSDAALISAADQALYAAKNSGRNRVVVHQPAP